jgi:hypothetical protein
MAEANDDGNELTEIIVNAPDHGGYGGNGGGGGGFIGDFWANWTDSFIFAGFYNGPSESGGGDSNGEGEPPEIVVTAPPPPPPPYNNTLENSLAVITDLLSFDSLDDYIGYYRLRLTPGENGRIELDLVDLENGEIDTYVVTQSGGLEFSTPFSDVTAYPDQPWEYTGPSQEPFPTEGHHWA